MNTSTLDQIRAKRDEIQRLAALHGAANVRLFGSVVRGEDTMASDIDVLVDTGPNTSSWFPAGLILDLENLLGRRVEVVTEQGLSPFLRHRVIEEALYL